MINVLPVSQTSQQLWEELLKFLVMELRLDVNGSLPSASCVHMHVCWCVCSPLLRHFYLKELTVGVTLIFPRKEGAEQDRLVIYSSCEFKLAEEGGMACRKFQEVSQVCSSPKGECSKACPGRLCWLCPAHTYSLITSSNLRPCYC